MKSVSHIGVLMQSLRLKTQIIRGTHTLNIADILTLKDH